MVQINEGKWVGQTSMHLVNVFYCLEAGCAFYIDMCTIALQQVWRIQHNVMIVECGRINIVNTTRVSVTHFHVQFAGKLGFRSKRLQKVFGAAV